MEEKSLFERMAEAARELFLDLDERGLYEGCDYLPVWHYHSGRWFGSGDFPAAYKTKAIAKRVCANQVRREGINCDGYVAERKDGRVRVYRIGEWQRGQSSRGNGFATDPGCWSRPLATIRLDGLADWEVAPAQGGVRSRLSPLAQRAA